MKSSTECTVYLVHDLLRPKALNEDRSSMGFSRQRSVKVSQATSSGTYIALPSQSQIELVRQKIKHCTVKDNLDKNDKMNKIIRTPLNTISVPFCFLSGRLTFREDRRSDALFGM